MEWMRVGFLKKVEYAIRKDGVKSESDKRYR